LGAAYAAGLATGFFKSIEELRARWSIDRAWKPRLAAERRETMYRFWKKAVTRSFDWEE
jgi:glycerol kinase